MIHGASGPEAASRTLPGGRPAPAGGAPMYLVTGATGFVGSALLGYLRQLPELERPRLALLVRDRASFAASQPQAGPEVTLLEGGVEAPGSWQAEASALPLRGIFHLAALVAHRHEAAASMQQVNVLGTEQVAHLARSLGVRLVLLSSSGTVACSKDPAARPDESAPYAHFAQAWPYYASKIAAEERARAVLPTAEQLVILRPAMVLGPGDQRYRSTRTVVRFLRGQVPFVLRGGIEVIDVRDLTRALWRAMQRPTPAPVYHLPGHAMTLAAYFAALARVSGRRPPRGTLPEPLAMGLARGSTWLSRRFPGLLPHPVLDVVTAQMGHHFWATSSAHAAADLGHVARPLDDTLRATAHDLCARRSDCGPPPRA